MKKKQEKHRITTSICPNEGCYYTSAFVRKITAQSLIKCADCGTIYRHKDRLKALPEVKEA